MPDLESRPDFLTLWGLARGAVENPEFHGNRNLATQFIHQSYRDLYADRGVPAPRLDIQSVNAVLSRAYEQRAAKRELGRALTRYEQTGQNQSLERRMMARDVDVRPGAGWVSPEKLRVRIGYSTTEETLPSQWVTRVLDLGEVSSVAEIQDLAEEFAASKAEDYGLEYDGLDSVEITFY